MSQLDDLIQADGENTSTSRKVLTQFDPELGAALDTAAEMFRTFAHCMDGRLDDSTDLQVLEETEKELGIGEEKLIELIQSSDKREPILDRARAAWQRSEARRARVVAFLMLERYYLWAATDLLRVRLSPVLGYQRLQAESLALLFIMREEPASASRWMRVKTGDDGKHFSKRYKAGS